MKMFGTFLLMSLLTLPLFVQAETACFPVTVVCAASDPVRYADKSALVEKECLAVVYVFKAGNLTDSSLPPFTIDAAGQLVTKADIVARWGTISTRPENPKPKFEVVGTVPGVPTLRYKQNLDLYSFDAYIPHTEVNPIVGDEMFYSATAYLVAMDTRFGDKTCKGAPKYIAAYGVSYLGKLSYPSMSPTTSFMVGTQAVSDLSNVSMPILSCKPAPMVEWSYNGQTYRGEALDQLLTPTLSAMGSTADGMELSLSLSPGAEAPILYTLQTKAALSEPWENFETIAEKKALANFQPGGYTRFQVEGQKVLSIPRMAGETTRFYRVVGE